MSSILQPLLTFILLYKYAAIFLLSLLGSLALPIPSGALLATSFFFAAQGYMDPILVAINGLAGNVIGDLIGFWVARRFGKEVLRKVGLGRWITSPRLIAMEHKIAHHPIITVFWSRFATTVSPIANVLAGYVGMPFATFLTIDILGQAGEVALNFVWGTLFQDNWTELNKIFGRIGIIALALLILSIVVFWKTRARARAAKRR